MADDLTVHIDGKSYAFDDFELGDLEWLEEYLGKPLSDTSTLSSIKAAVGLVFLVKRRDDPSFTIEQARGVKMAALSEPTEPAAKKRPPKPAAR
jgi:hypothetical protein